MLKKLSLEKRKEIAEVISKHVICKCCDFFTNYLSNVDNPLPNKSIVNNEYFVLNKPIEIQFQEDDIFCAINFKIEIKPLSSDGTPI